MNVPSHSPLTTLVSSLKNRVHSLVETGKRDAKRSPDSGPPPVDSDRLKTPVSPSTVADASAELAPLLEESDRTLVDLLNGVQNYVERHEYVDRHGNAFFERLVEEVSNPDSLVTIAAVRETTVVFICPAEIWAQITHDLGYTDREATAVADAHQLYANRIGLAAYGPNVRVMCVAVHDRRRRDLVEQTGETSVGDIADSAISPSGDVTGTDD